MVSLRTIIWVLVLIALIHGVATYYHWYWILKISGMRWLDKPMHVLGGFWVALVFIYLNNRFRLAGDDRFWVFLLMGLSFVALIGVFWEFAEFAFDFLEKNLFRWVYYTSGSYVNWYYDTLIDLFDDLLGGALALFLLYRKKQEAIVLR